ncbi:hypothetical protein [Streptomyces sp. MZ04]|uniref:hypothetical protein n=1 Tax=Streptomyces sp. MZ04 TaxID=2559236 RepID=UPI001FD7D342|nr:hypothetical protein [Streptomyces sp. MZ04]
MGAVHAVQPEEGETVVISGAAGGVGSLAVQLARRTGATCSHSPPNGPGAQTCWACRSNTPATPEQLGPTALLAVTQLCVLGPDRSHTAAPARTTAAAALPNRRALLRDLGYEDVDSLGAQIVDAIVAHGTAEDIAHRVHEQLDAGADHVSLHLLTTTPHTPPTEQWRELAAPLRSTSTGTKSRTGRLLKPA